MDLELLAIGDLPDDHERRINEHLADCTPCRERLWRIRQEQSRAQRAIPQQAPVEAFRAREQRERSRAVPWLAAAGGWAAAACLLWLWAPWTSEPSFTEPEAAIEAGTRTKGTFAVQVIRGRGSDVERLGPVAVCRPGDRLQFEPELPDHGFLSIVNVQDDGQVQPYLPPTPVSAAKDRLNFSVELDDFHGRERIFFVWSPEPVDSVLIQAGIRDTLLARPLEEIDDLPLPATLGADQRSVLIYKESAR